MTKFRSRRNGSRYPVKSGKPCYPTKKDFEETMKKEPFSESLGWTNPKTGELTKAGKDVSKGLSEGMTYRKEWSQKFYEEYGFYPSSDAELDDYIKAKNKK